MLFNPKLGQYSPPPTPPNNNFPHLRVFETKTGAAFPPGITFSLILGLLTPNRNSILGATIGISGGYYPENRTRNWEIFP